MQSSKVDSDPKKMQIRNTLLSELDKVLNLFKEIEESTELQTVYNIFLLLQRTNMNLLTTSIHDDLCIKFYDKILPTVDVDFFLNYDIATHIRSTVTSENIYIPMVTFCKKMQQKMIDIQTDKNTDKNKMLIDIAAILQKVVKLSKLYNK